MNLFGSLFRARWRRHTMEIWDAFAKRWIYLKPAPRSSQYDWVYEHRGRKQIKITAVRRADYDLTRELDPIVLAKGDNFSFRWELGMPDEGGGSENIKPSPDPVPGAPVVVHGQALSSGQYQKAGSRRSRTGDDRER